MMISVSVQDLQVRSTHIDLGPESRERVVGHLLWKTVLTIDAMNALHMSPGHIRPN